MHTVQDGAYARVDQGLALIKASNPNYHSVTTQEVMSVLQAMAAHESPYRIPNVDPAAIEFVNDEISIGILRESLLGLDAGEQPQLSSGSLSKLTAVSTAKAAVNLPGNIVNTSVMAAEGLLNLAKCLFSNCTDYVSLPRVPQLVETSPVEDIIGGSMLAPLELAGGAKAKEGLEAFFETRLRGAGKEPDVSAEKNFSPQPGEYLESFTPSPTPLNLVQNAPSQARHSPDINFDHIIDGNINGFDKGSGGHYVRSPNVRIVETLSEPDSNGVFAARTQIRNSANGAWIDKPGQTTFYPAQWTRNRTKFEIEEAFKNSNPIEDLFSGVPTKKWEGVSPSGVKIQGYYTKPSGGAATAWPLQGN